MQMKREIQFEDANNEAITWWKLVGFFDAADRAWYHVDMLSLLAQILLKILHKVQRVRFFFAHWKKWVQLLSLVNAEEKKRDQRKKKPLEKS